MRQSIMLERLPYLGTPRLALEVHAGAFMSCKDNFFMLAVVATCLQAGRQRRRGS